MKKEMNEVTNEARMYKVEANVNGIELERLQKDNMTMKKVLNRYRKMICEQEAENKTQ